ncbi:MAG TPA: class A beta-lactamase [Glaciihabitans sp.]|nr:class A beta-lactamase [Glaciihabitans sp.]
MTEPGPLSTATAPPSASPIPTATSAAVAQAALAELEEKYGATLGVYAVDTGTGAEVTWRADDRFAFASTTKALAAGVLLDQVGAAGMSEAVPINAADLVSYSPITEQRAGQTMTLAELAEASVRMSNNTAANLVTAYLGGPDAVETALEQLGDTVTDLARTEPALNEAVPGDIRDTTTPRAIAGSLGTLLLGSELEPDSRELLTQWMVDSPTGATLIRAGVPAEWTVADKSGAGGYGTRNNIAVLWPTTGAPIVMAVMSTRSEAEADFDDQLIADAAAATITALR